MSTDHTPWVWFDLDDTLVDFTANSRAALTSMYADCHLSTYFKNVEEWLDSYHHINAALWRQYDRGEITQPYLRTERFRRTLAAAGVPDAQAAAMAPDLDRLYLHRLAHGTAIIPGAHHTLELLRNAGARIGVLSNGFAGVQQTKLQSASLTPLVDLVVLSDDINVNKPDTRLYRHAMQRVRDTDPTHHIMVGDNPATDIAGALAAGWHAILFDPLQRHLTHTATPRIASLAQAPALIFNRFWPELS